MCVMYFAETHKRLIQYDIADTSIHSNSKVFVVSSNVHVMPTTQSIVLWSCSALFTNKDATMIPVSRISLECEGLVGA